MQEYFWTKESSDTTQEFQKKWIWIKGGDGPAKDPDADTSHADAIVAAKDILNDLQAKMDWMNAHTGFAKRSGKGALTKTEFKNQEHDRATLELKNASTKYKYTVGKWLLFPKHSDVDRTWLSLGPSIASGALRDAGVFLAKVGTSPGDVSPDHTHVICLYVPDVYDKTTMARVLGVLLTQHGLEPSAAKSDLYTLAGIDSSHPTKLRSSIWRPAEVLDGGREETLKSQYKPPASTSSGPRKPTTAGADGMIESDSEDERIAKGSAAPARKTSQGTLEHVSGPSKKSEPEGEETAGVAGTRRPREEVDGKETPRVKKIVKRSKAQTFQDNDIFAATSDSD